MGHHLVIAAEALAGKPSPVPVPLLASATALKPHLMPRSCENVFEVSTIRASIITCGVSESSVEISWSSGCSFFGMSLMISAFVRLSTITLPREERMPPSRMTFSTSSAFA